MKFLPYMIMLIALVMLMAGSGRRGVRVGQSIAFVVVGAIILMLLFGVILKRAL